MHYWALQIAQSNHLTRNSRAAPYHYEMEASMLTEIGALVSIVKGLVS